MTGETDHITPTVLGVQYGPICFICVFSLFIIHYVFWSSRITTEQNLAAKIVHVAKWTDEKNKIEDGLKREIQDKAKTM